MNIEYVVSICIAILLAWFGSLEYRMRSIGSTAGKAMTRDDTERLIDLKQQAIHIIQREIRDDIRDLVEKVNKVLDKD